MNRSTHILVLTIASLVLGACSGPSAPTCNKVTCSSHGTCQLVAGKPACACDIGYEAKELECVPEATCREMGRECVEDWNCCDDYCLHFGSDEVGYCSTHSCSTDYDCVNHADDGEMCCVDVGGENFVCMKIQYGFACPSVPTCGLPCETDGDCNPSERCIVSKNGDSFCSIHCSTDSDCAMCGPIPPDPDMEPQCLPDDNNDTWCQIGPHETCTSSADCQDDEVCFPYPTRDGQQLEGNCGNLGDLPAGSACDSEADPNDLPSEERCKDFYCFEDHCSEVCSQDQDCPEDMVCGAMFFCMDDACNTSAHIGMCRYQPCCPVTCTQDADCADHEVCAFYLGPDAEVIRVCQPEVCDPVSDPDCSPTGGPCGDETHTCQSGICLAGDPAGTCASPCETDLDCPDPLVCLPTEVPYQDQFTVTISACRLPG